MPDFTQAEQGDAPAASKPTLRVEEMEVAEKVPPNWGTRLNDADYTALEGQSWIDREVADAAMLRRVDAEQGREVVGQKGKRDCAGILFPNYLPGESRPRSYFIRRDN